MIETTQQEAWRIDPGHIASSCEDGHHCSQGIGRYRPSETCPHVVIYRDHAACMDSLEAFLRHKAETDPLGLTYKPPWGPEKDSLSGLRSWKFRVRDLRITRHEKEIEVWATFDCQTLHKTSVRAYAEVNGERIEAGWHQAFSVETDWRPLTLEAMGMKAGDKDDVADGLYWRSWTVEPQRLVLFWGDAALPLADESSSEASRPPGSTSGGQPRTAFAW